MTVNVKFIVQIHSSQEKKCMHWSSAANALVAKFDSS